jgi:diguanylate cyclase (GGDEF)-like protein
MGVAMAGRCVLEVEAITQVVDQYDVWYQEAFHTYAGSAYANLPMPAELVAVASRVGRLKQRKSQDGFRGERLTPGSQMVEVLNPDDQSFLKRLIILKRRAEANRLQLLQDKTHHLEILGALDKKLAWLDEIIEQEWFQTTPPFRLPRPIDYVPMQLIQEIFDQRRPRSLTRKYDEKFHILQAPELFLPDLSYYRAMTDLRGTNTAVAFLDIDHFKSFNTDYKEAVVDRNILPRFMQLVEAHVCFHGHAYRQGGDEYLIVLPGLSREIALDFLDDLRIKISKLDYPAISRRLTVSMGVCIADEDCYLTDREIQEQANRAKEVAKNAGRNQIASFTRGVFTDANIEIVRPRPNGA